MAVVPYLTVPAPVPPARQYGLFSVITPTSPTDSHWQVGGAQFTEILGRIEGRGGPACYTDTPDADPIGIPKNLDQLSQITSTLTPFAVLASMTCTPGGGTTPETIQQDVTAALLAGEQRRVEQAVWTGDLGSESFTTDAEQIGTAVSATRALADLERWLSDKFNGLGVIHVTVDGAVVLARKNLITFSGSQARTVLGTPVVIGSGYPGTGPDGSAPAAGTTWAYATGAGIALRSGVFTSTGPESWLLGTGTNDLSAIAERTYVVGWGAPDEGTASSAGINLTEED